MGRSAGSKNKISKTTSVTTRGSAKETVFSQIQKLASEKPWKDNSETLNSRLGRKPAGYLGDYQEAKALWLANLDGYSQEEAEALWQATRGGYLAGLKEVDNQKDSKIKAAFKNGQLIDKDGNVILDAKELEDQGDELDSLEAVDDLLGAAAYDGHYLKGLNLHGQDIGPLRDSFEGLDAPASDCSQGSFTWVSLEGSSLNDSNFQGTTFDGTSLSNSRAEGSDFSESNFINSDLDYSYFDNSNFSNSVMLNCDLTGSDFTGSNFQGALLDNVKFSDGRAVADLAGADFSGAVILNSDLRGLDLSIFKGADIRSCLTD